ncbi:MAG: hypothetical protein RI963_1363 [Planctomycetota bacterium]|jgi:uncharacterized membrane protein YbhN (UPF0104 family)
MTNDIPASSPGEPFLNDESSPPDDLGAREELGDLEAVDPGSGRTRRILFRLLRWGITLAVLGAVLLAARGSIDAWRRESDASRIGLKDIRWDWIGWSALAYAVSLFPSGLVLAQALRGLRQRVSLPLVTAAQLIGHLGKYVPGKAMVVVLRAAVLNRGPFRVSARVATAAVVIETASLVAVGSVLSLALVLVLDTPSWLRWGTALLAAGGLVGTLPPVLRMVFSRRWGVVPAAGPETLSGDSPATEVVHRLPSVQNRSGGKGLAARLVQPIPLDWTAKELAESWLWCTISWVFTGLSMTAIVLALIPRPLPTDPWSLTLISSAAAMLAFVAGFLSLLPGGALVRELVLATLLQPVIGQGPALLAAVAARLVQLAVECFLCAGIWLWLLKKKPTPEKAPVDA